MNGKWVEIEDTDGGAHLMNIDRVDVIDDLGDYSRAWLQDNALINIARPSYSKLRSILMARRGEAAADGN